MSTRALIGLIRFMAATVLDLHRYSLRYFAEEIDRAEQARRRR